MAYYICRLKYNRNVKIMFFIIFTFMSADLLILNSQMSNYSPHFSTFLSGGSGGHYMQMLILWLLPAYLLLGESSWYLTDEKTKNSSILITKFGKKKYIRTYLINVFLTTFILFFINFIINYGLALFMNYGDTYHSMIGIDASILGNLEIQLVHPIVMNMIIIFGTSLFISMFAVFMGSLSFFFNKKSYMFLLSFVIWFVMISGEYSILLTFQPFNEYSFAYLGKIYGFWLLLLITFSFTFYVCKAKQDDI